MAGELVAQLDASAFFRETSVGYQPESFSVLAGATRGIGLNKFLNASVNQEYYQCVFTIPANLTMATGLTFLARLVDDGKSAVDPGTVVKIGVTAYNMDAAGFTTALTAGAWAGAEQTATATLSATPGTPVTLTIPIAAAQLGGAAVANNVLLRIRRLGTDAADTCPGRVVLLAGHVKNT